MKFWIVDAFTKQIFKGNPAAVILVSDFPEDALCFKIAAEFNLSETAFVKRLGNNHFHIRWFTPAVEVKLCGHATLASCFVLKQEQQINITSPITLESLSGPLSITCKAEAFSLNFPLQKVSQKLNVANFQHLCPDKVLNAAQALDDVIIELNSEAAVRNFKPDFTEITKINCRGLIITAKSNGKPYDFVSRFFGPRVGVNEDPVTGSAHCKLADYWQHKLNQTSFFAYQASVRGGEMGIQIEGDRVQLIGDAVLVGHGALTIEQST